MTTIDRLQIQGIRSFDNQIYETIKFRGCLTLIVGQNGSGKTTIIECLKYATTGQQPPNSAGGAFIHDPKLCGEKEVMAQVKLRFHNASTEYVVSRQLQLTVAKSKRSLKSLEMNFQILRNGEKTSFSKKVADLDKLVPQRLGVSEAVLSNVIFCHQDESLWPMSTAADLKKKFDLIFDAVKYTKAVDNLRLMKKDRAQALKELTIHEENFKQSKDKGERVKAKTVELQDELEEIGRRSEDLLQRMNKCVKVANEKKKQAEAALGVVNELKTNRDKAAFLEEQIEGLRMTLEELQESDEWLEQTSAQYDQRMAEYKEQGEQYDAETQELSKELLVSRQELSEKQSERGQYLAEKNAYEGKLQAREQMVRDAAVRHGERGFDGELSEAQIKGFASKMRKLLKDKDRELEATKSSIDKELQETQSVISELSNRRNLLTQNKLNAKQLIKENDHQSSRLQRELDSLYIDEGRKAAIEAALKDAERRHQEATSEYEAADWDRRHKTEISHLRDLESESERLREDLTQCTKFAKDQAALEHVKVALKEAKSGLDTMKSTYGHQLSTILGSDWEMNSLERRFQAVTDQKARVVVDAKKQQEIQKQKLDQVEWRLQTIREGLKKSFEAESGHRSVVLASIQDDNGVALQSIDEYEEALDDLKANRDETQKSFDGCVYVNDYYTKCLTAVNDHGKCKLCDRKFATASEKNSALAKIQKQIAKNAQDKIKEVLDVQNVDYQKAAAVRPRFDSLKALIEVEIPKLEDELREAELERTKTLKRLDQEDSLVSQEETAKRDADALSKPVTTIIGYMNEISKREAEIDRISSQQKVAGSSLTVDELNEKSALCVEQMRIVRGKVDKLISDKHQAKSAISALELEVSNATRMLNTASNEMEKKQSLSAQIDSLKEKTKAHRQIIQQADADLEALVPDTRNANAKHEEAVQRGRSKESGIQTDKDRLSETVNKFGLIENDIDKYIANGGSRNLEACQRAIKDIEQNQKRIDGEISKGQKWANELRQRIDDNERTKRSIDENIRFRGYERDLKKYQQLIGDLEKRNVQGEFDRLSNEAVKAEREYQELHAIRGPLMGTASQLDKQLADYIKEWNTEYQDAAHKYREGHIKVETTKAAIEDIDKYRQGLEHAIMQYHSIKMEEINRIISEIWTNTYRGSDIDAIMVKSENDAADKSNDRRSYNYRVVMVKDGEEMDMRGRCSAGQKVLASIIIRLALAECFGVGCGIIALDEPTTNLDRETIKSLAESLGTIIEARRAQSNFQLVIITHDAEFLKAMEVQKFTDTFWHVDRNNRLKSYIEEKPLGKLSDLRG